MKSRAGVFGAGMGIVTIAVIYGVLANGAVTDKFAKSVEVNNVLGLSEVNKGNLANYDVGIVAANIEYVDIESQTKRATLQVVVKNNTPDSVEFSPGLHMHLIDASDTFYAYTAEFLAENETIGGTIVAGESMDVVLDFVIPASSTPASLELAIDAQNPYRINL